MFWQLCSPPGTESGNFIPRSENNLTVEERVGPSALCNSPPPPIFTKHGYHYLSCVHSPTCLDASRVADKITLYLFLPLHDEYILEAIIYILLVANKITTARMCCVRWHYGNKRGLGEAYFHRRWWDIQGEWCVFKYQGVSINNRSIKEIIPNKTRWIRHVACMIRSKLYKNF